MVQRGAHRPVYSPSPRGEEARALSQNASSLAATPLATGVAPPPGTLGRGWIVIPRGVIGWRGGEPIRIDVVLLHSARGIALLETPPHWTEGAPALLLRHLD